MSNNNEMLEGILSVIISKITEQVMTRLEDRFVLIEGLDRRISDAVEERLEEEDIDRKIEIAIERDIIDERTIDRKISDAIDEHNNDHDHDEFMQKEDLEKEVKMLLGDMTFKLVTAE